MNNDKFISIGFGNIINSARVLAVVNPDTLPSRRLIQESRECKRVIDATCGRKTRAVLILDSGHIALCGMSTDTIAARLNLMENVKQDT